MSASFDKKLTLHVQSVLERFAQVTRRAKNRSQHFMALFQQLEEELRTARPKIPSPTP
jgi:hypothetical protein